MTNLYAETADLTGRDAVYAATEMIAAAIFALNRAGGDRDPATDAWRYRSLAVQSHEPTVTPYAHLHDALDGVWRELATIDGHAAHAKAIVGRAGDIMHDLMGEDSPARRAYEYAREEYTDELTARATLVGTVWVCVDCALTHANGECGESSDREPLSAIPAGHTVTLGLLRSEHAPSCDSVEECDCATDAFSTVPCAGCGSTLAGERHAMALWREND